MTDDKLAKSNSLEILDEARRRIDESAQKEQVNRDQALEDLQFAAGDQWPQEILKARKHQKRPMLTINRLPQFVRQVTGDIRQNKPSIKVRAAGGKADAKVAEIMTGLIRNIEVQSKADTAYITAVESAARCGIGHFRVDTQYSNDDSFEQDIRIRRIQDPFAVYWDPACEEWDRSDARFCFVTQDMPIDEFKQTYPKATVTDFEAADELLSGHRFSTYSWWDRANEKVRVAEYWRKVPDTRTIYMLDNGSIVRELPEGVAPIAEREVVFDRIEQYLLNGVEILEANLDWPGKHIPIISVLGEEVHIGDEVRRYGIVRFAKDAQRNFNYMRTASVETVALQPKAPYLVTAEQIEGREGHWAAAGHNNHAYLVYKPDPEAPGPPQRAIPPQPPAGFMAEVGLAAEDLKSVTGIYDAALGNRSNETSGVAITARQRESDVGTYVYVDNLSRAIQHCGKIIVDLIPHIYDTDRTVRVMDEEDEEDQEQVNIMVQDGVDDADQPIWRVVNDLSVGEYDVTVTVGPSYTTKRIEAANSMIQFMQAVPGVAQYIGDLFARSQEWPGAQKIAERLEKLLPPHLQDNPEPQPPDPMMIAQAQKLEAETQRVQAQAQKDFISVAKTQADIDRQQADTVGQRLGNIQAALQTEQMMGQINSIIEQQVAQALPIALQRALSGLARPAVPLGAPPGPQGPSPAPQGPPASPNGGVFPF